VSSGVDVEKSCDDDGGDDSAVGVAMVWIIGLYVGMVNAVACPMIVSVRVATILIIVNFFFGNDRRGGTNCSCSW